MTVYGRLGSLVNFRCTVCYSPLYLSSVPAWVQMVFHSVLDDGLEFSLFGCMAFSDRLKVSGLCCVGWSQQIFINPCRSPGRKEAVKKSVSSVPGSDRLKVSGNDPL